MHDVVRKEAPAGASNSNTNRAAAVSLELLRKEKDKEMSIAKLLQETPSASSSPPKHSKPAGASVSPPPPPPQTTTKNPAGVINRSPFCIVWAPLPVISWLIPLIGHTGITNSTGVVYDFDDDFTVSVDNFSFGTPTKYYQFDPLEIQANNNNASRSLAWDVAIQETNEHYSKTRHLFCYNNCHQYIATVLNKVRYCQKDTWNQHHVWRLITFHSKYTNLAGFMRQWLPFAVILLAIIMLLLLILS